MSDEETKPEPSDEPAPDSDDRAPEPAAAAKPSGPNEPYWFLAVVSLVSLALDLGTKWWATTNLDVGAIGKRVDLIKGNLALVYARNKGGAWGLLQDEHEAVRLPFFLVISVAAVVFIVSLYRKLQPGQTALKWGLPLVLGGALGNLIDRIRYRHVVDFIDAYYTSGGREHHWPTFNVADIAIVVGVGLMAVDMFQSRKAKKVAAAAPVAPAVAVRGEAKDESADKLGAGEA